MEWAPSDNVSSTRWKTPVPLPVPLNTMLDDPQNTHRLLRPTSMGVCALAAGGTFNLIITSCGAAARGHFRLLTRDSHLCILGAI